MVCADLEACCGRKLPGIEHREGPASTQLLLCLLLGTQPFAVCMFRNRPGGAETQTISTLCSDWATILILIGH